MHRFTIELKTGSETIDAKDVVDLFQQLSKREEHSPRNYGRKVTITYEGALIERWPGIFSAN